MNILVPQRSQESFSKAACRYDHFSLLQKAIGLKLLEALAEKSYPYILDIGMGTGWLTEKITKRFPQSKMVGLDYAFGMAAHAKKRKIDFVVQADAKELPFQNQSFDLIVSNCAYQWVEDIPRAFSESARVLKSQGEFFFTCFGPATLKELREAISQSAHRQEGLGHPWHLLEKEKIKQALEQAGFRDIKVFSENRTERFDDCISLIHWLKSIGANRVKRNVFIGPQLLARISDYYQRNFSLNDGVGATFEVIYGAAKK